MTQYPSVIALSGLDGVSGFRLTGVTDGDYSGFSVAGAGDVNGDGFADVIIGSRRADPHGSSSGASYVVFGKASGFPASFDLSTLNGTNGFKMSGEAAGDNAGFSVASAGDINGDGFPDLFIGAPYADPHGSNSGASYVVFGRANGFTANLDLFNLNGTNGFKIAGEAAGDNSGFSVASAGDINGDGITDLILGAPQASPNGAASGASYVVFGHTGPFPNLDLSTLNGPNGVRLSGAAAGDLSGHSVAGIGDFNGDGIGDFGIGAPHVDVSGVQQAGGAYVVFGADEVHLSEVGLAGLTAAQGVKITGVSAYGDVAWTVSGAGDINGDGFADLFVGERGAADPIGAGWVILGQALASPPGAHASGPAPTIDVSTLNGTNGFKITGAASGDYAGVNVASAGDVNGDGFDDLLISGIKADGHAGAVYVVFGKASGFAANINLSTLDGTNGFKVAGVTAGDYAGFSASSAGDVNGDGLDDLIIGAPFANPGGSSASGASYIVFGRMPDAAVTRTGTAISQNLVGGNFADVLTGGGGNDKLYGNGGNDLLTGAAGNDYFNGGTGVDTVSYQAATAGVHVSLLLNTAQNTVGAGTDTLISIEKLVGSLYADTLIAGTGGSTLNGGNGGDDLFSGPGSDILNGGGASDFADYALATAGVTVSLAITTFQNTVGAGSDELVGIEKLSGSAFADSLTGDGGVNIIYGVGGADTLNGGGGGDFLYGGAGADSFVFSSTADTTVAAPDTIGDFQTGDHIDLHLIDANTAVAGDQAFHMGATPGHAGDIVVGAFSGGHTVVSLYVNADATPDAEIILTGDHHGLTAGDFVL